jgi:hypothetical protein
MTAPAPASPIAMLSPAVAPTISAAIAASQVMARTHTFLISAPKRLPRVAVALTGGST